MIENTNMRSIYEFTLEGIDGSKIDLGSFEGKKLILVNTASACGYTPQYGQMQELYENFSDRLVILGLPSNDFGGQEPKNEAEIKTFCIKNYGVEFPLSKKIKVLGPEKHPLFTWLEQKAVEQNLNHKVEWNFTKFLINETGELVSVYPSSIEPLHAAILEWLGTE